MTDDPVPFGALLRAFRVERGWSLRDLGERVLFNRGYIGNIETGEKFPQRHFAEHSDRVLGAGGSLVTAWDEENDRRRTAQETGRLLTASVADSLQLITAWDTETHDVDSLREAGSRLPVEYLTRSKGLMLMDAIEIRAQILQRLRTRHYGPTQLVDLYQTLGLVQGVLSYAALDLGQPNAAFTHAQAAWSCADRIDNNAMRAWVRGTQSLILRFQKRYETAEEIAQDGLGYPASGTTRSRLLAGIAQCRANLGDYQEAIGTLDQATDELKRVSEPDPVRGIYEFSRTKQHYYAASSLMWSEERTHLARAARDAETAFTLWENEPPETRSLDDEALARVYAATAHIKLGDLDSARQALVPVLALPPERRISWILTRLRNAARRLEHQYPHSTEARTLRDEITAITTA